MATPATNVMRNRRTGRAAPESGSARESERDFQARRLRQSVVVRSGRLDTGSRALSRRERVVAVCRFERPRRAPAAQRQAILPRPALRSRARSRVQRTSKKSLWSEAPRPGRPRQARGSLFGGERPQSGRQSRRPDEIANIAYYSHEPDMGSRAETAAAHVFPIWIESIAVESLNGGRTSGVVMLPNEDAHLRSHRGLARHDRLNDAEEAIETAQRLGQ